MKDSVSQPLNGGHSPVGASRGAHSSCGHDTKELRSRPKEHVHAPPSKKKRKFYTPRVRGRVKLVARKCTWGPRTIPRAPSVEDLTHDSDTHHEDDDDDYDPADDE